MTDIVRQRPSDTPAGRFTGAVFRLLIIGIITLTAAHGSEAGDKLSPKAKSAKALTVKTGTLQVPLNPASVEDGGVKLYYELYSQENSKAAALVVLHGGPGDPFPLGRILTGSPLGAVLLKHYRVLYYHQRGAGKSKTPDTTDAKQFTMSRHVADLLALQDEVFGAGSAVTLLGSSWGGYLGLGYAAAHPGRVKAMILGSFESTATSTTTLCPNFNDTVFQAAAADPDFNDLLNKLEEAIAAEKLIWRKGKPEQTTLRRQHIMELIAPFMIKARYDQLKLLIGGLLTGDSGATSIVDSFDGLDSDITVTTGGSPGGAMTYCNELADTALLKFRITHPTPTYWCDDSEVSKALLKECGMHGDSTGMNLEAALKKLDIPALIFAGELDPFIPWKATARVARWLPRAAFVLVAKGGHTPFKAGGACLAGLIDTFAGGEALKDTTCP